ncbi:UDP-N-acetylmuramoyl-tripeptide--D-alanyl-D-alanine ligase [Robiginitalea sp. IMCC44478]|uniref:UDP-N-acetylmuramoyl-tripeptide--D-alanyl-D- alanine ligase n=1 Tax=Robiginitalea sp. IMCC44478 TaxID=3459122 RepID=UPI0040428777
MKTAELHQLFLKHRRVSTDSRKISGGCIYFALKGPNFNGNRFAAEALKKGAAYAVVDEEEFAAGQNIILVKDALKALQDLGTFHRNAMKAKVVALTGSNGKTTTKELIHAVLQQKFRCIATKGNLNNHIGVPLTLLQIGPDTELAIVEMGANHQGEIAFLSQLAQPDYGYITNFGKAHLEGFGGVQGVIKGKSELYTYLINHDKHVFINADDPIQLEKLQGYPKTIGFSQSQPEFEKIRFLKADPFVSFEVEGETINTQLSGSYNFSNCAAAARIGTYFGVSTDDIKTAIQNYIPENNRSQLIKKNGVEIILDAYNANPSSMMAALEHFAGLKAARKVAILGDMFELGEDTASEHSAIARLAASKSFDALYLIGANFFNTRVNADHFKTFEEFAAFLKDNPLKEGATVLIKGSRGMALERSLDYLGQ